MAKNIDIPKLDWFERYKLANHAGWLLFAITQALVLRKWGHEGFKQFETEFRYDLGKGVGKKLVEKLKLEPNIEGALKLAGAYTQEVWGYGDPRFVDVFKKSPQEGVLSVSVCRGWEKWNKNAGVDCSYACAREYQGVLDPLSHHFRVTLSKAYPRGDDRCEFVIKAQSAN